MSALLKFPTSPALDKKICLIKDIQPDVQLSTFNQQDSAALLEVAQRVWRGLQPLIDLVDSDRALAGQAGIETIAIELMAERGRIGRVKDSLEDASRNQENAQLSMEGLELLRRSEKLLAEASSNITRFTGVSARKPMGNSIAADKGSNDLLLGSLLVFGVVLAITVIAAVTIKK